MEERNEKYTLMEGHELPSGGKIYGVPVQSHVELRGMTARDEMKRLAPSTMPLKTLADIIDSCLIEKLGIPVYDLCFGDYEYLLHKLRIITYGPEYKVVTKCPDCDTLIETTVNLEDLILKTFDPDEFETLRTVTLPKSNHTVKLRPMTPRLSDMTELRVKELKRRFKNPDLDFETLVKLELCIEEVDGNSNINYNTLEAFITNLPAADMVKLWNISEKVNTYIGLENIIYLTCPECGKEFINFFRFGPEFFRPTNL